jgi:dTDP-glucose 4,6-dehydratase
MIPKFVGQMLQGHPVTVYNDGQGSRDWLHATDHARAIAVLCEHGVPGEAYNLAAGEEHYDAELATWLAAILAEGGLLDPQQCSLAYTPGRPGHDRRYAMDGRKLRALGWQPQVLFAQGLQETVLWTAQHADYWQHDLVEVG